MSVILCEKEVKLRAQQIILCPLKCSIDGLTLQQIALDKSICFYVGTTKQHDIELEDLRWLTARGTTPRKGKQNKKKKNNKTKKYAVNRPVLNLKEEHGQRLVSVKEARDDLGFVSECVFESPFLFDVTRVEDAIQRQFQHLQLGHRLWRHVAKGKSADKRDIHNNCIYRVFITLFEKVRSNENIVVVAQAKTRLLSVVVTYANHTVLKHFVSVSCYSS
jgi:hypothetical protein